MPLLLLGLAAAAPAQHLTVSLGTGGFFPSDGAYRQIYGSGLSLAGDVWFTLGGRFGIAAGFGRLSDNGLAVPIEGGGAEYPVSLRRTSIPVIAYYALGSKAIDVRLGAGGALHSYKETWQTVDLDFEGSKLTPRLVLAVSVAVIDKLSLFFSASYDAIPTGAGSLLAADINLGGFQVLGGLAFRIF
jgi:hypothetical protein